MSENCTGCKFFKKTEADWGTCRRYAPKPQGDSSDIISILLGPISQVAFNKLPEDERCEGWQHIIADSDRTLRSSLFAVHWPEVSTEDFCGEFMSA